MPQLLSQKYIFIIVSVALIMLSTLLFVLGEQHFNFSGSDIKTFILSDKDEKSEHDENFYRKLMDNPHDEFIIMETDVMIRFVSSKWGYEMNLKNDDIIGKNFFSLVHSQDLPFIANALIVVLDSAEINNNIGPFRLNNKEDESRLYMAKAIPIFNEEHEVILIGLVLHDISNPLGGDDQEKDLSTLEREDLENLISMAK